MPPTPCLSVRTAALALAAGVALMAASPALAQTKLTIAGFGGNLQTDLRKTLWQPAADKVGVSLREETHDGLAAVRVQVQSGKPSWNMVHLGADECAVGGKEGLFEPIDYKTVDAEGVPDGALGQTWVAINSYSVVLGWRTAKYGQNPPRNWQDFWNVKDFPGRRSLGKFPQEMLEIALLGDGVPRDKLYPLDTKRALAALERIKPDIAVWWASGAQSAQLIKDGEVDMLAIWGSRMINVIKDGAPVEFTYQDGILGYGCLAILKGSSDVPASQKFIGQVVSPDIQSRIVEMMDYYGPVNSRAFEFKSFDPAILAKSNTSPENTKKQVILDVNWWRDHNIEVREAYNTLRSR